MCTLPPDRRGVEYQDEFLVRCGTEQRCFGAGHTVCDADGH
jgi:hypothetical protein